MCAGRRVGGRFFPHAEHFNLIFGFFAPHLTPAVVLWHVQTRAAI